jgi:hypothetical protein
VPEIVFENNFVFVIRIVGFVGRKKRFFIGCRSSIDVMTDVQLLVCSRFNFNNKKERKNLHLRMSSLLLVIGEWRCIWTFLDKI